MKTQTECEADTENYPLKISPRQMHRNFHFLNALLGNIEHLIAMESLLMKFITLVR